MGRRLSRTFTLLAALAGLAACVADPGAVGYGRPAPLVLAPQLPRPGPPTPAGAGRRVALLLPLTGANAELGQAMLKAAQLVLDQPGAPPLDPRDTGGTPEGAAMAARAALDGGAGIILGPLTAGETAAAGPVARAAGVPVLAFTSDPAQAQPGVWTMGITPAQQARRLVRAIQAEGKTRVAAVVPQNAFGDALANGLLAAASAAALPEPRIVRHPAGFAALDTALRDVAGVSQRRGTGPALASAAPPGPSPVDVLLLGDAGGVLNQAVPLLKFYDIGTDRVRILGPALWARQAAQLGGLAGAWYAAPDPAARGGFEQQYAAKYATPPRDLTSLVYDSAAVARALAGPTGFPVAALTRPEGFTGADGVFVLQPDGQVRRGLAVFEIDATGAHIVQPAPQSLTTPES